MEKSRMYFLMSSGFPRVLRWPLWVRGERILSKCNSSHHLTCKKFSSKADSGALLWQRVRGINMAQHTTTRHLSSVKDLISSDGILRSEFPPVPIQTEPFSNTFLSAIWHHFCDDPDRPAMINAHDETDRVTFGQLYAYAQSVGAYLKRIGFNRRDVACIVTQNCWQYMAIFGGVSLRCGTFSGVSESFKTKEQQRQFDDCRCTVIFTSESNLHKVLDATTSNSLVKKIIVIPDRHHSPLPLPSSDERLVSFAEVLREDPIVEQPSSENFRADEEILFLPYSSGTTGIPKGVMLSHKNFGSVMRMFSWQFNNKILNYIDPNYDYRKEIQLDVLPFYHIFGFAVIVNHLLNGSTVVVMGSFNGDLTCHLLEKYKCRFFLLVPPIMLYLSKFEVVNNHDLSHLRLIVSGAAPAGRELCEELHRRFPWLIVTQGYGMTELSICSHIPVLDGKNRYDTAGKLMPNMELKILDLDTNEPITAMQKPGELYLRGPNVMMGYLRQPKATAQTLYEGGWLRTGDVAYVDEEGYLHVVDRLKELIKVRGYQVAPAELEDALISIPGVSDCAVVGVPDESAGEVPIAFIVRSAGSTVEAEDVHRHVNKELAHYKQLKGGVVFVDHIPKSASGKILRREIREKYLPLKSKL